jgi:hypothetical protein
MPHDFSTGTVLVPTSDGNYVTLEQQHIAEILHDYDDTLDIVYIPPDKRVSENLPWAVVCHPRGQPAYFVFYAEKCDQRILERIWTNDNAKMDVLGALEAKETAQRALKLKKQMDESRESAEFAATAMRSPLNWYNYKGADGTLKTIRN